MSAERLGIISLVIGIISFFVTVWAAIYAYMANKNSEQLLRRLIIEPMRHLDRLYSSLESFEQERLLKIHREFGLQAFSISAVSQLGPFFEQTAEKLAKDNWLIKLEGNAGKEFFINPDRLTYLETLISQDTLD